jgi:hypothetical protein
MGDVSERQRLKEKLQCKPFQYFVDRFRSVFDMKHMLPTSHFAIKDEASGQCLEAVRGGLRLGDCSRATGPELSSTFRFIPDASVGSLRSMKFSSDCFDANSARTDRHGLKILLFNCQGRNPNQSGWSIANGGITWGEFCAFIDPATKLLTHGTCTAADGEFLGKKFKGHSNHRFVIIDEQQTDVAKSDKDLEEDDE